MIFKKTDSKRPSLRGLATLALLKARFDEGADHIDMFMPLVKDTIVNMSLSSFSAAEVQQLLHQRQGIVIPHNTVSTLLKRATRKGMLKRESGKYTRLAQAYEAPNIIERKRAIEAEYKHLAQAFQTFAARHKLSVTDDDALALIVDFLKENKVEILLGAKPLIRQGTLLSKHETRIVAEFVVSAISSDSSLGKLITNLTEGLVVYNTAFLNDISEANRKLTGLRIFFDSHFLRQAVGYEGTAQQTLARETLDLLRAAGTQCLAFDTTVYEVQRILKMYENNVGTTKGRKILHPSLMTKHVLTTRYTPSDIRQLSALLPQELVSIGIQISPLPRHTPTYTLDEKKLAQVLADFDVETEEKPRVVHDVGCVAGVLTLRAGARSTKITGAKAVFATTSNQVLRDVQKWYLEEGETGICPAVHLRALSNLAWLRRPALGHDLKVYELIALCQAAVQPSRKTWKRFLDHLNKLEKDSLISTDEAVAVVISELTENSVGALEELEEITESSLDEVINRVRASYASEANKRVVQIKTDSGNLLEQMRLEAAERIAMSEAQAQQRIIEADGRVSEAERRERERSDEARQARRINISVEGKAQSLAHYAAKAIFWIARLLAICGAVVLVITHPFHSGVLGWIAAIVVVFFVILEAFGVLKHLNDLSERLELFFLPRLRRALGVEPPSRTGFGSVLGINYPTNDRE